MDFIKADQTLPEDALWQKNESSIIIRVKFSIIFFYFSSVSNSIFYDKEQIGSHSDNPSFQTSLSSH